ncbi:MAG: S-adenosylmethionine:tRNA ribosyltransferase-isomerase [Candidatus Aquilonibacter sp.]
MSALSSPASYLSEATEPPERRGLARDEVRMLVTNRMMRTHRHARFLEIESFLCAGDLLVVNDSATLPAAIPALRADGSPIALHVSTQIDTRIWMTEPRGTVLCGEELHCRVADQR